MLTFIHDVVSKKVSMDTTARMLGYDLNWFKIKIHEGFAGFYHGWVDIVTGGFYGCVVMAIEVGGSVELFRTYLPIT